MYREYCRETWCDSGRDDTESIAGRHGVIQEEMYREYCRRDATEMYCSGDMGVIQEEMYREYCRETWSDSGRDVQRVLQKRCKRVLQKRCTESIARETWCDSGRDVQRVLQGDMV
ncbi:hypothetical protein BgiMline_001912 [Biomphalaria glabrata]|nr:hypothetical protein BgiMline_001786 [Biomphalaria glabrata]